MWCIDFFPCSVACLFTQCVSIAVQKLFNFLKSLGELLVLFSELLGSFSEGPCCASISPIFPLTVSELQGL